ncbi:MAG: hypothetical protein ABFS12_06550 [Bacteroidota bacterium]
MRTNSRNFSKSIIILFLFAVSLIIYQPNIYAQKIEITPFYGYQFAGKVVGYNGDLNIRNNGMYGASLDITVQKGLQLELFYSRSDTRVDYKEFRGPTYRLTDMSVNYFQLGAVRHLKKINNIVLYGVGSGGAVLLSPSGLDYDEIPEQVYYDDWWFFALTVGGGAKIFLSEKIGIRFEGRLMMPITWAGGGFMIGTGGSGFYLGGGSAILQASVNAGLIIALGK